MVLSVFLWEEMLIKSGLPIPPEERIPSVQDEGR